MTLSSTGVGDCSRAVQLIVRILDIGLVETREVVGIEDRLSHALECVAGEGRLDAGLVLGPARQAAQPVEMSFVAIVSRIAFLDVPAVTERRRVTPGGRVIQRIGERGQIAHQVVAEGGRFTVGIGGTGHPVQRVVLVG